MPPPGAHSLQTPPNTPWRAPRIADAGVVALECKAAREGCLAADRSPSSASRRRPGTPGRSLEHLECSWQPHIQGRGAKERTQRAG